MGPSENVDQNITEGDFRFITNGFYTDIKSVVSFAKAWSKTMSIKLCNYGSVGIEVDLKACRKRRW